MRRQDQIVRHSKIAALGLSLTLLAGCVKSTLVPAAALPALNGAHTTQVGSKSRLTTDHMGQTVRTTSPVMLSTVRQVVTLDGNTAEITGEFDAAVHCREGRPQVFEHPVIADVEGEMLIVQGANRGRWSAPLAEVEHVEIRTFDPVRSNLVMLPAVVGGSALLAGIILSALPDHEPRTSTLR